MEFLTEQILKDSGQHLQDATQHEFLSSAGQGVLNTYRLKRWLVQDMHYTRAYVRFIGGLITKLQLEITVYGQMYLKNMNHEILDLLIAALLNIQREMAFFEDVAVRHRLNLDSEPTQRYTRSFIDLFETFTGDSEPAEGTSPHATSLLAGLTVLWTTELKPSIKAYLSAWTFAKSNETPVNVLSLSMEQVHAYDVLHQDLIPNWTSQEFAQFVSRCADAVNVLAAYESVRLGEDEFDEMQAACSDIHSYVLWIEKGFWPNEAGVQEND